MKKNYINPSVRVVEVECDALLALSTQGEATNGLVYSRRELQKALDEEEDELIDMLLMQQKYNK